MQSPLKREKLDPRFGFYRRVIKTLNRSKVPFLVGGAFALERYTGIARWTKDFDIFVRPRDCKRALDALSAAGYKTELTFPHWIGKAFYGDDLVDVIFGSGNGVCRVDDEWFKHAIGGEVFDTPVKFVPPEEVIWQKAFIMERERCDGADIAHIIHARGKDLDWPRLLSRFSPHWRVLFCHLVLFGFIYPDKRSEIPNWVMDELIGRLRNEINSPPPTERICRGTLLSLLQYEVDLECWGYKDARLIPRGNMTREDIEHWTEAFKK